MIGLVLGVLLLPTICGYTWPAELDVIIKEEAVRADVPLDLAYTFVAAESGFDPGIIAEEPAGGRSYGLLQLYEYGQGAGYPEEVLLDPRRNLQIGLPHISAAFKATWSPTITPYEFIWLVSIRSGHPGEVPRDDYRIKRIAQIWTCFFPAAGISGPGGAPGTATGPGPAVALAGGMPAIFLLTLFPGGLLRSVLPSLEVQGSLRAAAMAITPGGITQRLQRALDPREVLSPEKLFRLPRWRARLPARHRPPRR